MKTLIILIVVCLVTACSSNSMLSFEVKITTEDGIDPRIARSVVLAVLDNEIAKANFHVGKVQEGYTEKCMSDNYIIRKEFCKADYIVFAPWEYGAQKSWGVKENCNSANECAYSVLYDSLLEE